MNTMKPTAIMQEKIWIKCMRSGFIPQLRMQGPIITPVQVTREVAHQMVVAGLKVYQIDPDNRNATELTLQNVFPGEGDPVPPVNNESPKVTSGVNSDPITPVDLKGVRSKSPNETDSPKKKAETDKIVPTPEVVASESSNENGVNDSNKEEDKDNTEAEIKKEESNNSDEQESAQNTNSNDNGNKSQTNNQKHKNNKKNK